MIITFQVPSKKTQQSLKFVAKLIVTVLCLWYISGKIELTRLPDMFTRAQPLWLVGSLLFFACSKLFAAFRLNIYFRNIGIVLPGWTNIRLYWLGMFYNLFLPGSISGDAYKVVRLTKAFDVPYKKTGAAVLLDRFSGLAALGLLLGVCWLSVFHFTQYSEWVMAAILLIMPVFYLGLRFFFPAFLPGFWPTFGWGMAVQLFQVASMYCIIRALGVQNSLDVYMLIFLVSSVLAVLPFTIGGLGAREMMFLWAAQYFLLDQSVSVMASALFYLNTLVTSGFGLIFVFLDPLAHLSTKSSSTINHVAVQE